jgi:uncharacterized membrane protein HdeD (DUF308 family)
MHQRGRLQRVIGLFIGIEMLFNGWAWVMLALGLRAVAKNT